MKEHFVLQAGEKIVFKVSEARISLLGPFANNIIVTNKGIIIEKFGTLGNFKGIERYAHRYVRQAIIEKASNGENHLTIFIDNMKKTIVLPYNNHRELKTLALAINDQISEDGKYYDAEFYQRMLVPAVKTVEYEEIKTKEKNKKNNPDFAKKLATGLAKDVLLGRKITSKRIAKRIIKTNKQEDSIIHDSVSKAKDELRDFIGLPTKNADTQAPKEARKTQKRTTKYTYEEQLQLERQKIKKSLKSTTSKANSQKAKKEASINEQIQLLKELKQLLDDGILTQEEFDNKKKEILNN